MTPKAASAAPIGSPGTLRVGCFVDVMPWRANARQLRFGGASDESRLAIY